MSLGSSDECSAFENYILSERSSGRHEDFFVVLIGTVADNAVNYKKHQLKGTDFCAHLCLPVTPY